MPAVFQLYCNPLTDSRVASDWQISHIWLTEELTLTDSWVASDWHELPDWQLSCLWLTVELPRLWLTVELPSLWQLSCLWLTVELPRLWQLSCLWLTVELPRLWQLSCLWLTVELTLTDMSWLWLTDELPLTDMGWLWLTGELTSSDRWSCLYEHVSLDKPAGCPSSSAMQAEIVSCQTAKQWSSAFVLCSSKHEFDHMLGWLLHLSKWAELFS